MPEDRIAAARRIREDAARMAEHREHPNHVANGDEQRYGSAHYPMNFTKGLDHDEATGLVANPQDFEMFRLSIDSGEINGFTTDVSVPAPPAGVNRRQWEAPTAGVVYDLQGPDAQAVTMPAAPELGSDELAYEMAEVYELALLRDTPFLSFDQGGGPGSAALNDALDRLNALPYATNGYDGRPRITDDAGNVIRQTAFRGSSPGVEVGPYLSQFMMIGNDDQAGINGVADGFINYGALAIDQRVLRAADGDDYMQVWGDWHSVQQGFAPAGPTQNLGPRRFIYTPRDLATYVHFDALYEAYLNACLLLLEMKAPFDPSFANLSGMRPFYDAAADMEVNANAGGFALFGGPHILTLVTEVATRALKAVRFQKFNNHLRLRPEALAARIERANEIEAAHIATAGLFTGLANDIGETVQAIRDFNPVDPATTAPSALLPMAFAEGSPMHPSYGAGHATVAGACVTMLKAFFDTGAIYAELDDGTIKFTNGRNDPAPIARPVQFEVVDMGNRLDLRDVPEAPLTLEGELNKLAANISIGRNMAGVHYFSDYYDSLRMGEEIAIGILEEQALCYPTDQCVMSVPTFDGELVRIGRR